MTSPLERLKLDVENHRVALDRSCHSYPNAPNSALKERMEKNDARQN
jgi:hypothetical protein